MTPLFRNRNYLLFLGMRISLTLALQILAVVAGWQVFKITRDPLSLGMIGLAEVIPALSLALFAGHIADLYNKQRILTFSLLTILVGASGMLVVTAPSMQGYFAGTEQVPYLYACIFITGLARAFYAPTAFSMLHALVKREQLAAASTINSSSWQMASIAGPAIGGLLYGAGGITTACMVMLLFILIAVACILMVTYRHQVVVATGSMVQRLKEGIGFVFHNKIILSALSLDLFAVLFGGAVALLPVFADEVLKTGPEGLGMLRAAPAAGASLVMITLSALPLIKRPGVWLLWSVAGFGICMILFALSVHFYLSLLLLFLSGGFDSVSVVIRGNILQLQTPDQMRGRVAAVNTMFIGSSNELGAMESGIAARLMGTVASVISEAQLLCWW